MKLREWVTREGLHYQTASRWWQNAKLPIPVTFETEPPTVADWQARLDTLAGNGLPLLVARTGGEVAGYGYVSP